MTIHLTGASSHSPEPRHDYTIPAGRARSATLGAGRPCTYLGSQDGKGLANNQPSRMNMCFAQPRREWKGLRRITVPYSRVTRERQGETCFAAFNQCPFYQQAVKEEEERNHHPPRAEAAQARPSAPAPQHRKKRGRPSSRNPGPMSARARSMVQYAAIAAVTMICALVITLVISAEPSRLFDFVFEYIALQDIKSVGSAESGADKSSASGMVTGGNLKAMQNMSADQKDKLKNSAAFKSMSEADKAKLKEKYKSMMGK